MGWTFIKLGIKVLREKEIYPEHSPSQKPSLRGYKLYQSLIPPGGKVIYPTPAPLGLLVSPKGRKKALSVGSHVRHYWQNEGMAPNPLSLSRRHGPGMKELGLAILTCSFLSSGELVGKNVKVQERSMRKHKTFCSCAQKIICKLIIGVCSRIFTKNVPGWACRPQLEAMGRIVFWDLFVREIFMAKEVCWV